MKQPDLGTALMVMMVGGAMFFLVGVRLWKFGVLIAAGLHAAFRFGGRTACFWMGPRRRKSSTRRKPSRRKRVPVDGDFYEGQLLAEDGGGNACS